MCTLTIYSALRREGGREVVTWIGSWNYMESVRQLSNTTFNQAGSELDSFEQGFVTEGEHIIVTSEDRRVIKQVASQLLDYPIKGWQVDTLFAMKQKRNVITLA